MKTRRKSKSSPIRAAIGPAAAIAVIALFGGSALFGQNGVFAFGGYNRQLEERQGQLAGLQKARDDLAHRVALLDPKKVDPDLADELVRTRMGVAHPDDLIIPLD